MIFIIFVVIALVCSILVIPITFIQALLITIISIIKKENLFEQYLPISGIVFCEILKLYKSI